MAENLKGEINMITKKEKIVVEDLRHINGISENCFKVIKAVNTIKFPVGKYLSAKEVEDEIK